MGSLQEFIIRLTLFIGNTLLPFLFGLAFLFFLYNTVRFFIVGAGDSQAKESAKRLALYGIGAFVFLVSIWGIVNLLVYGIGIGGDRSVTPDYIENTRSSGGSGGGGYLAPSEYSEPYRGPR